MHLLFSFTGITKLLLFNHNTTQSRDFCKHENALQSGKFILVLDSRSR